MSNDVSKVYQFLSTIGDWKTKADKNGDGTIIKSEFRNFMLDDYEWDGETTEAGKNDLINSFWKSIDTNQSGKISGTRFKNKNALDSNEEGTLNAKILCYEELNSFIRDNVKLTDAPSDMSSSLWKKSVSDGLSTALENFIKNKNTSELNKALQSGEITELLQKQLPLSKGRATADYYTQELSKQYKSELGGYELYSDSIFKELLDKYVASKFQDGADTDNLPNTDEIKADMEKLVKAYLASAGIGDGNVKDLEEEPYGWRQGDKDNLTDLQKNQVTQALNTKIESSYETLFADLFAGIDVSASDKANLKTAMKESLDAAKTTFINSLTYGDFKNLETKLDEFRLSDYVNTEMKNNVLVSYYTNKATEYISSYDVASAMGKTLSTELVASIKTNLNGQVSGWVNTFVTAGSASNEFETYLKGKIEEYLKSDAVEALIKAEDEKNAKQKNETIKSAASALTGVSDEVKNNNLSEIMNGKAEFKTAFGMDSNGNIIFNDQDTTNAYNTLVYKIKTEINKTEAGKAALETLGGDSVLKKLIQAAWIDAYNTFNSSQKNTSASFISQVLDNFQKIMNTLAKKPEYLSVYTSRTSYADTSLTNGLVHYGTNTTGGSDERIVYDGDIKQDDDGTVHLNRNGEDQDYQVTMSALLKRLQNKYSSLSTDLVTNVFRNAQKKALETCQNNTHDCPNNTGCGSINKDGYYSRSGDHSKINMDELVEITLYYFDKLLYQELGK